MTKFQDLVSVSTIVLMNFDVEGTSLRPKLFVSRFAMFSKPGIFYEMSHFKG